MTVFHTIITVKDMKLFQHIAYAAGCIMIGIGIGLGIGHLKDRHINREARKIERETR